jgi:M6 family metalloprotease-like protein
MIAVAVLAAPRPALAINASPFPAVVKQPDGTSVTIQLRGDEYAHWNEDGSGYPVIQDADGWWKYAQIDAQGVLRATSARMGTVSPAALGLNHAHPVPEPRPETGASPTGRDGALLAKPVARQATPRANGTVKNLVVLLLFSDHTVAKNGRLPSAFDSLYNGVNASGVNAPSGSVRDFYFQASYGTMTLQSTVLAWVTLPHTEAYYSGNQYGLPFANAGNPAAVYPNNAAGMLRDALPLVDALVNFSQFDSDNDGYVDAIDFIHSGYGGENSGNPVTSLWSHMAFLSSGTNFGGTIPFTSHDKNALGDSVKVDRYHVEPALWGTSSNGLTHVGVIAHETGHYFGLPDLYDTDYTSYGIGNWCMMANSWGWDQSQLYPPLPSAWCRVQLGWVTPTLVNAPGNFSLPTVETTPAVDKIAVRHPGSTYMLVENRQPVGFDQQIPHGGLAIWMIDDAVGGNSVEGYPGQSGWPGNGKHFKVALLQADGHYDLEKNVNKGDATDLYYDVPGVALDETTTPKSDAYATPTGNQISAVGSSGSTMGFHYRPATWIDVNGNPATAFGSYTQPQTVLSSAINLTANDGIVIMKGGHSTEKPNLTRPMFFKSYGGTATVGP